jgi:patatin-related protein
MAAEYGGIRATWSRRRGALEGFQATAGGLYSARPAGVSLDGLIRGIALREKELRLALVWFGGVSLAVYMHGVSKEILKLVRASKHLHGVVDPVLRAQSDFFDHNKRDDPEYDTEPVYYDLLREIGADVALRVVVDVIAGASAGGINGVMLARALAHDLPMRGLRDLWLEYADVTHLLADSARAKPWSKFFLTPLLWGVGRSRALRGVEEPEARRKLSLFVRSRWFKPPFDGDRMTDLLWRAIDGMGEPADPSASLLPTGHSLESFVTLTDYFGYERHIRIHSPALISEREHRHTLRFAYQRWPSGEVESDFSRDNVPALAFAARATSAFPGAFPPAQIGEIDRLLRARGQNWARRDAFLATNFAAYHIAAMDPRTTAFIDGSVLINKPFDQAIQAIKNRPAFRQVDRRLVYIDPDPVRQAPPRHGRVPGFFMTLKGALSDIPRNEPIADELSWVAGFNERVRGVRAIVDSARPQIARLVAESPEAIFDRPLKAAEIRNWRKAVNVRVARDSGFAYEAYVRLKMANAQGFLARVVARVSGVGETSPEASAIGAIIARWAAASGVVYSEGEALAVRLKSGGASIPAGAAPDEMPAWTRFLLTFDVEFRQRRLNFLIGGQNRLYRELEERGAPAKAVEAVDRLKRDFYRCLDRLRRYERADFFADGTRRAAGELFGARMGAADVARLDDFATEFAAANHQRVAALFQRIGGEIDLARATDDVDDLVAAIDPTAWDAAARRELLINHIGFAYWDVLTLPLVSSRNLGELDEIRVDRISPLDAHAIPGAIARQPLKGINFAHFGAFFSRAWRENDYLWGRLHAIDRLIDLVCDSAGYGPGKKPFDVAAFKRRAMEIVMERDAPHLKNIQPMVAELRQAIAKISGDT